MDVTPARHDVETVTAALIGVASGLGARDQGCADGPAALRAAALEARLAASGVVVERIDMLLPEQGFGRVPAIADLCRRLAERTGEAVAEGERFAVLGGDHSCAAGSWAGVSDALDPDGPLGLVWIDAHLDSHDFETSPSGNPHGMPVAALLGYGSPALAAIARRQPALDPRHLCLVGARSAEPEETALLSRLGVRVIDMEEVRRIGLTAALDEAVRIATDGTAGAGISVDLDALDPLQAPGVGSPVAGGIDAVAFTAAMGRIGANRHFVGCEVVEYNPALDEAGRTAEIAAGLVQAFLAAGRT